MFLTLFSILSRSRLQIVPGTEVRRTELPFWGFALCSRLSPFLQSPPVQKSVKITVSPVASAHFFIHWNALHRSFKNSSSVL